MNTNDSLYPTPVPSAANSPAHTHLNRPGTAPHAPLGQKRAASSAGLEDEEEDDLKEANPRRKIKIEYIEDKSRRHITFSKRKAGIMKKAYELSTLTGTQVLLLVASETGHVYTFATPKLQPLITKPEGKALIQTCLNAQDGVPLHLPPSVNPHGAMPAPLSNLPPRPSTPLAYPPERYAPPPRPHTSMGFRQSSMHHSPPVARAPTPQDDLLLSTAYSRLPNHVGPAERSYSDSFQDPGFPNPQYQQHSYQPASYQTGQSYSQPYLPNQFQNNPQYSHLGIPAPSSQPPAHPMRTASPAMDPMAFEN
ncbi:hypothetical protein HDV03_002168 [Kappamyces sp. JEL0829]|nr:hypothetical protein HDV03_002168 [Kappamyces sp. JEL0829]